VNIPRACSYISILIYFIAPPKRVFYDSSRDPSEFFPHINLGFSRLLFLTALRHPFLPFFFAGRSCLLASCLYFLYRLVPFSLFPFSFANLLQFFFFLCVRLFVGMFCFCGFNSIFAINCFGTLTFYKAPSVESAQCGRVSQLAAVRILAVRISCPCPWLHPCPCPGMQLITFAYLYLRAEVEMRLTDIYFRPPQKSQMAN